MTATERARQPRSTTPTVAAARRQGAIGDVAILRARFTPRDGDVFPADVDRPPDMAPILLDAARRIPECFAGSPAPYLDVVTYPDADLAKPFVSIPTTEPATVARQHLRACQQEWLLQLPDDVMHRVTVGLAYV